MRSLIYATRAFAVDLLSMIAFLVVFLSTKNIYLAIGVGVVTGVVELVWHRLRGERIGAIQWASLGLVVLFGGATLVTHDPRFIMVKPTLINAIMGSVMLKRGWMERYLPAEEVEAARPMLNVFGYVWAGLMFMTAAANLVLVAVASPRVWALFNLVWPPASMIGLFVLQNLIMRLWLRDALRAAPPAPPAAQAL